MVIINSNTSKSIENNTNHAVLMLCDSTANSSADAAHELHERISFIANTQPTIIISTQPWRPFSIKDKRSNSQFEELSLSSEPPLSIHKITFLSLPKPLTCFNGISIALSCYRCLRHLKRSNSIQVLDAHSSFPNGYAATLLGKWLNIPGCITLYDYDTEYFQKNCVRFFLKRALLRAKKIISTSETARQQAFKFGIGPPRKIITIKTNDSRLSQSGHDNPLVSELMDVANGADYSWPRSNLSKKLKRLHTRLENDSIRFVKNLSHHAFCTQKRKGNAQVVFVAGSQRSGTNMLMEVLDRSIATDVYHEYDPRAFDNYTLRDLSVIDELHRQSCASFFILKSLCELPRLPAMMARYETAKCVWIVRDYRDVINSMILSFPPQIALVQRIAKFGDKTDGWRSEGLSEETRALFQQAAQEELNNETAAALMWYSRNILFFEKGLQNNPAVMIAKYECLVASPDTYAQKIYDFINIRYSTWHTRHIFATSIKRRQSPQINSVVKFACDDLMSRLDNVHEAPLS